MIGPGWMPKPNRWRRTLAYTRLRRRRRNRNAARAIRTTPIHHEEVMFGHGPSEFPTATVLSREPRARATALAADLGRWLAARWAWFKPRTVPVMVAAVSLVVLVASADYLAHQHVSASHITHYHAVLLAPR